jgi:prepilin-type N-terminal cleavage/methylation domain-containing protein
LLCRGGFTLVEILAVLAILAMFVTLVTVNYQAPLLDARLQNAFERMEGLDRTLRLVAQNQGRPIKLRIDLAHGELAAECGSGGGDFNETYTLPAGIRLEQLCVDQERIDGDEATILFSSAGTSATYAIGLTIPDGRCRWLLVVGATGQTVQVNGDDDLKQYLSFK